MPQTARWLEIARVEFEAAQGSCAGFGAPLARCLWKLAGLGKRHKHNKYICNVNFILGTPSYYTSPLRLPLQNELLFGYAREAVQPARKAPLPLAVPTAALTDLLTGLIHRTEGHAEAQDVAPERRQVPDPGRRPAVPGGAAPAPAPVHPERACSGPRRVA
jgi:hypothetical protein